jgi:iron complex outermembrane recepter protein
MIGLFGVLGSAAEAWADDSGDGEALQQVVVTATKRATKLEDTPVTVQAITGDTLAKLGADSFRDYAGLIPGLSFIDLGNAGPKLTMRGLSTSQYSEPQPTVGIYVDEIPATDAGGAAPAFLTDFDMRLHDIDRIEVLKGPQGTLFGESSMGGTIRIITNQPDLTTYSALVGDETSVTDHGGFNDNIDAVANIPLISSVLGTRLVGYYEHNDGWIDNIALGARDVNDEIVSGGRLSVLLAATSDLQLIAHVNLQDTTRGGFTAETLSLGDFEQSRPTPEDYRDDMKQFNLTGNYAVGGGSFVSSTSYIDRLTISHLDVTDQIDAVLPGLLVSNQDTSAQREFTEEFRYVSAVDRPLQYIVGLFDSHLDREFMQSLPGTDADALYGGIGGSEYGIPNNLYVSNQLVIFKELAAFGELTYQATPRLAGTLGLRWFGVDITGGAHGTGVLNGGPTSDSESGSDHGVLPKYNLSYKLTDEDLLYATVSKGYRRGGVNQTIPSEVATCLPDLEAIGLTSAPQTYNPDTVWNYELGTKTQWLDGRVSVNADAYYMDWKGIPGTKILSCGFAFTENAGNARVIGTEWDAQALVTEGLKVMATFDFTESNLTAAFPEFGAADGDRVPGVPRWTWSGVALYEHPVTVRLQGYLRGDLQHIGASYTDFTSVADAIHLQQYNMIDVSGGFETERWQLGLFVDNLGNTLPITNAYDTPFANFVVRPRPRTVGLRGQIKF